MTALGIVTASTRAAPFFGACFAMCSLATSNNTDVIEMHAVPKETTKIGIEIQLRVDRGVA